MFRPMFPAPVSAPKSLAQLRWLDNGQRAIAHLDDMAANRRRAALQWWVAPVSPSRLVCCSVCGYPSLASVRGACECPEGADWVDVPGDLSKSSDL